MAWTRPNWTRILTILLVILATLALLYIGASILFRFTQALLLFVLGSIVAYVLSPLVSRLTAAFHFRWVGVILAYLLVVAALVALVILLFTPFIQQSRSLISNLHDPSTASLSATRRVITDASRLQSELEAERAAVGMGANLSASRIKHTRTLISQLQHELAILPHNSVSAPHAASSGHHQKRQSASPQPQTQVPESYVSPVGAEADRVAATFQSATSHSRPVDPVLLKRAAKEAKATTAAARHLEHVMATTPILLLRAQTWLDGHNLKIDLHQVFGQATGKVSDQGTTILNHAITVLSETATILLDITLVLIISFYMVNDGSRMIRTGVGLVPAQYREQVWFFIASLDHVLGGYIRGQLVIALLAGILGGGGAAVLGVPYPLLIGIITAVLELVPVIGPMVTAVPAVLISLFFSPVLTTLILLGWFIIFQQIVTNIVSPRIMGMAVGIHPLEALLAVLVGYPLGGLLGAFLAVPVMGLIHLLVREAYAYFVLGKSLPTAPIPVESEAEQGTAREAKTAERKVV